ncbi:MAG: amidohydrolase [Marmoricola sp.]
MSSTPVDSRTPATSGYAASLLVRAARIVPVRKSRPVPSGSTAEVADIRIVDGTVQEIAGQLVPYAGESVLEVAGRWVIPGLWDQHVHMSSWTRQSTRVDLTTARSASDAVRAVAERVATLPARRAGDLVFGGGFLPNTWREQPTVAALDAVGGDHPVVLQSADSHTGWLNSTALRELGAPPRADTVSENEWFALLARLDDLPGARNGLDDGYRKAVGDAAARGVVGVVDMDLGAGYQEWPEHFARGADLLRVRPATYPDLLEEVIAAGLRTGDPLPGGHGLLTMGPLKVIGDGSMNSRTAYCCEPYADVPDRTHAHGAANFSTAELTRLLTRARQSGLDAAVHAIGDAAAQVVIEAFAETGAPGSIEHAQLMTHADVVRMATLGLRASVQPAHLLDDRDVTAQVWPDRLDRCFMFATMLRAGVTLALGSDAPVAPLDPWLAMAAAVHRTGDSRDPWNGAESLTAAEALAASIDGQGPLAPGGRGDLALLDDDPLLVLDDPAEVSAHLRSVQVAATLVAGRVTHQDL